MAYHGYNKFISNYCNFIFENLNQSNTDRPVKIIEIGIDRGSTLFALNNNLNLLGVPFEYYGIDIFIQDHVPVMDWTFYQRYENNKINLIEKNSLNYLKECNEIFDVILIDGDHNYRTVSEELSHIDKISHLNVFSDLAVTTLSSVIGERSGLLTANTVPDELKIISGVKCSHNAFSYAAIDAAAAGIEKRIRDLDERCNKEHVHGLMSEDDIGELLIKRIETLTSSGATLWLPANCMKTGLYSHVNAKFRFGMGLLDSLCKTGMIEISDEIEKMFGNLGVSFLPASILINALSVADGVLSSVRSAGGCVVVEQVNEYPRSW